MLINVLSRAREMSIPSASGILNSFLKDGKKPLEDRLDDFCQLDDFDIVFSVKEWVNHKDKVISDLSKGLINRNLLKINFFPSPVHDRYFQEKTEDVKNHLGLDANEARYLVFRGEVESRTYDPAKDHINILFKSGQVKDISEVDNPLINQTLFGTIKKFYICYRSF